MKRTSFVVMGGLVVLVEVAAVIVLGADAITPATGLLGVVGALFAAGGIDPLPDRFPGYYFIGVGNLLLGIGFLGFAARNLLRGTDVALALGFAVAGVVVAGTGIVWFRDGWETQSVFDPVGERDAPER